MVIAMKAFGAAGFIVFLVLWGCVQSLPNQAGGDAVMQIISLQTSDNIKIKANFFPVASKKAVILVHQFNQDKSSYNPLAALLSKNGFGVLAVDLRGHGESRATGTLSDPTALQPADFQNMPYDLDAALLFLKEKGFSQFYFVGASIGANLAIMYPADHAEFKASVALSPGEDFKSLQPLPAAMRTRVPTLIVASREDVYSFASAQKIADVIAVDKNFIQLDGAGHGTFMLANKSGLSQKILEWFQNH